MTRRANAYLNTRRWKKLRLLVLRRDLWQCQIRGPGCIGDADQVDHIIEFAEGGREWDEANLRAACHVCNNARNSPRLRRFLGAANPDSAPVANLSPRGNSPDPELRGDYSRKEAVRGAA